MPEPTTPIDEAMGNLARALRDHHSLVQQLREAKARVEQLGMASSTARDRVEKAGAIVREHLDGALQEVEVDA